MIAPRVRTVRVARGSALERLVAGQSFTEALHVMAEKLETLASSPIPIGPVGIEEIDPSLLELV